MPELKVARADKPLKLDGKLDEEAWSKAQKTDAFVNTMNGEKAEFEASVKALYDDKNLYIAFDVADEFLKSTFTNDEDHLWEQDTVEIMADPDGDGKDYIELQVSPANKRFDTHYESRRVPRPFGHMDYDSKLQSGVSLRGKLNDDDDDQGYTVEIAIPWAAFSAGESKVEPPKSGDTFRLNFYVMDQQKEGMRAAGWSPPRVGDFHVPQRFGKLVFE
ncbi:MAG TPA: carbohydrate-binding family 9-like protein [Polyangiales bacterium]